ncbi:hypothetical protein INT45_012082 [Circinella minor]|uniref:Uncharacterized protein n=1 Tax=Circinella minor TaxID=1195481 RepID=A0A8H7SH84_9FUNG|nr:hypothetical protein INT45_012082 [Circinella minor]
MIVSVGAALTAAVLLVPGAQSAPAPPFNPEESSGTITKNDPQDDVDKDVVNDLADEWSTSDDSTEKNGSNGEEDVLPPDEQQDLSAMTDNDLAVAHGDDDDILLDNEKGEDSVFITTGEDDAISAEEKDEGELSGLKSYEENIDGKEEESVDSLIDDSTITTGAEENDYLLSEVVTDDSKETAVEEEDFTSLGDELDPLVTDSMTEELDPQEDLEQSDFDEVVQEEEQESGELSQAAEVSQGEEDSELIVDKPWDEGLQNNIGADQTEDVYDSLVEEETISTDSEGFLENEEVDPNLTNGVDLDTEEVDPNLTNGVDLDGEEVDPNLTNGVDLDGEEVDPNLTNGVDLDTAAEFNEEHINDDSAIYNEDGTDSSPVNEITPFEDVEKVNENQFSQGVDEASVDLTEESTTEETLSDDYQIDTSVQEINDTLDKALDEYQSYQGAEQQESGYGSYKPEFSGATNDPTQNGFLPDQNTISTLNKENDNSTLNMLLVLGVIVLLLFKLPKIKRWLSSGDQSSLPYHMLHKRTKD